MIWVLQIKMYLFQNFLRQNHAYRLVFTAFRCLTGRKFGLSSMILYTAVALRSRRSAKRRIRYFRPVRARSSRRIVIGCHLAGFYPITEKRMGEKCTGVPILIFSHGERIVLYRCRYQSINISKGCHHLSILFYQFPFSLSCSKSLQ